MLTVLHQWNRRHCYSVVARRLSSTTLTKRWTSSSPSSSEQERQVLLTRLSHDEDSSSSSNAVVSVIALNRPKANAMGSVMLNELSETLDCISQDSSTRSVVVTSSLSKVFSAGADLKERGKMSIDETAVFVTRLRNTMQRLARLDVPTLAAIEGVAVGGGLELALAVDMRIAGSRAVFGLPETSLAIVPGAGGTQRLPRLIGVARAKELIFTGRRIDASTALDYGLVQHMVEPGQAERKAIELAWQIAKNGPIAIRSAKEAIDAGMEAPTLEDALEIERECYQRVIPTKDRLEGLAAFREGRSPVYKGH